MKKWVFLLIAVSAALLFIPLFFTDRAEKNLERKGLSRESLLTELNPVVAEKKAELVKKTAAIGITILITDDFRSIEAQDELYKKGRSADGSIVTKAKGGESYHNYGLAVDFALRKKDGKVIWDMNYDGNSDGKKDWMQVVKIAKDLGFEWGGDWENFPDYPHLQMSFGLSIAQLQRGTKTALLDK
ncbi:M15 family metallopeptidase [Paenibacillus sp. FJAT-26967]|uniref:M15 family metallopeptidase n=1 Tax=Paenibacillus sp. FJAT-26967 TaxID=1729690 RepID=UPI000A891DA8|nr:M15 family metallopeptidase [Paenibacillus sp. FJAT-26967]